MLNTNSVQPISKIDFINKFMEDQARRKITQYHAKKKEGRKQESDFNGYLREASLRYKNHSRGCRYASTKNIIK